MAEMKDSFSKNLTVLDGKIQTTKDDVQTLESSFDQFKAYRQKINESISQMNNRMKEKGLADFRMREKLAQRIKDGMGCNLYRT